MASIMIATSERSAQSITIAFGILRAAGAGDAPDGRYGITGTPKGDIWFVSLAGPRLSPASA
jgi:hypothetical protein